MNTTKKLCLIISLLAIGSVSHANSILLNFGADRTIPNFNNNLAMHFTNVSQNINASLIAQNTWTPDSGHGVVNGNARWGVNANESVRLTLHLWDALSGDGFDTAYDPGTDYTWSLCFFDTDGGASNHDLVTLLTPGTYTITTSSSLIVDDSVEGQISFAGRGDSDAHSDGLINSQADADCSIAYDISNRSSAEFIFSAQGGFRYGLLNGGSLSDVLKNDYETQQSVVPEPATTTLLGLICAVGLFIRRRFVD